MDGCTQVIPQNCYRQGSLQSCCGRENQDVVIHLQISPKRKKKSKSKHANKHHDQAESHYTNSSSVIGHDIGVERLDQLNNYYHENIPNNSTQPRNIPNNSTQPGNAFNPSDYCSVLKANIKQYQSMIGQQPDSRNPLGASFSPPRSEYSPPISEYSPPISEYNPPYSNSVQFPPTGKPPINYEEFSPIAYWSNNDSLKSNAGQLPDVVPQNWSSFPIKPEPQEFTPLNQHNHIPSQNNQYDFTAPVNQQGDLGTFGNQPSNVVQWRSNHSNFIPWESQQSEFSPSGNQLSIDYSPSHASGSSVCKGSIQSGDNISECVERGVTRAISPLVAEMRASIAQLLQYAVSQPHSLHPTSVGYQPNITHTANMSTGSIQSATRPQNTMPYESQRKPDETLGASPTKTIPNRKSKCFSCPPETIDMIEKLHKPKHVGIIPEATEIYEQSQADMSSCQQHQPTSSPVSGPHSRHMSTSAEPGNNYKSTAITKAHTRHQSSTVDPPGLKSSPDEGYKSKSPEKATYSEQQNIDTQRDLETPERAKVGNCPVEEARFMNGSDPWACWLVEEPEIICRGVDYNDWMATVKDPVAYTDHSIMAREALQLTRDLSNENICRPAPIASEIDMSRKHDGFLPGHLLIEAEALHSQHTYKRAGEQRKNNMKLLTSEIQSLYKYSWGKNNTAVSTG